MYFHNYYTAVEESDYGWIRNESKIAVNQSFRLVRNHFLTVYYAAI